MYADVIYVVEGFGEAMKPQSWTARPLCKRRRLIGAT